MSARVGTKLSAMLVTPDTADTFPLADTMDLLGGFRETATLALRDAIPAPRRRRGMLVSVTNDPTPANNKVWRLGAGLTNADWEDDNDSKPLSSVARTAVTDIIAQTAPVFAIMDPVYGAIGNGTADDNTAFEAVITAAAAAGGMVALKPGGVHKVGKATGFTIPLGFKGFVPNGAKIKVNPAPTYTAAIWTLACDGVVFDRLLVDCDNAAFTNSTTGNGIMLFYVTGQNIEFNEYLLRGRAAFFIFGKTGCHGLRVTNGTIQTTGACLRGIHVGDASSYTDNVMIAGNTLEGSTPGARNSFINHGIGVYWCRSPGVEENYVIGQGANPTGFGISADLCLTPYLRGNKGGDTGREFINATECDGPIIENNIASWTLGAGLAGPVYSTDFGISTEGCARFKVRGNVIIGAKKAGIGLADDTGDSDESECSDNHTIDCAFSATGGDVKTGILIYATGTRNNTGNRLERNRVTMTSSRTVDYAVAERNYGTGQVRNHKVLWTERSGGVTNLYSGSFFVFDYDTANAVATVTSRTYLHQNNIAMIGDSRIANLFLDGNATARQKTSLSLITWANALLGQRMGIAYNGGISGALSTQYFTQNVNWRGVTTNNLTAWLYSNALWNIIFGAVNDLSNGYTALQVWNGYTHTGDGSVSPGLHSVIGQALALGKNVILFTEPGYTSFSSGAQAEVVKYNQYCYQKARTTKGVYVFDLASLVWDQAAASGSGAFKSGYSGDGVHLLALGSYNAGVALAAFLDRLIPPLNDRVCGPIMTAAHGGVQVYPNPNFYTTSGGTAGTGITGTAPGNVSVSRTGTSTATISVIDDPSGFGKALQVVATFAAADQEIDILTNVSLTTPPVGSAYKGFSRVSVGSGSVNLAGVNQRLGHVYNTSSVVQCDDMYCVAANGAGPTVAYALDLETELATIPTYTTYNYMYHQIVLKAAGAGSATVIISAPEIIKQI